MAKKPANVSPTKSGTTKKTKPAKKAPPKKETGHDWGDGRKVHTIKKSEHTANVKAKGEYGINPNQPLAQPLTAQQAYGMAQASADRVYAPQLQANQQMQRNTPSWYDDYRTRVTASQAAAQTYAQPLLANAQAGVTNAGQTTPGLAAGSPQAAIDQQAAQGRQSIAQLGYDTLAAVPAATNAYMSGQSAIASREQPQAQAALLQQYGQLGSQRAAAVTDEYGKLRTQEQNYGLAQATLGVNTADKAADNLRADTVVTNTEAAKKDAADAKAAEPNKYGIPAAKWKTWSTSHRQRVIDAANKKNKKTTTGLTAEQKAEEKRISAKREKSGTQVAKINDAMGDWDLLRKQPVTGTREVVKKVDGKDKVVKEPTSRAKTDQEIREGMRGQGYTPMEIHIALLRRVRKPLDKAAIDYLHSKGVSIPRDWLPPKSYNDRINAGEVAGPVAPNRPGGSRSAGLTPSGKTPTGAQVLANPTRYTAAQVKTAKEWKARKRTDVRIAANGGVG